MEMSGAKSDRRRLFGRGIAGIAFALALCGMLGAPQAGAAGSLSWSKLKRIANGEVTGISCLDKSLCVAVARNHIYVSTKPASFKWQAKQIPLGEFELLRDVSCVPGLCVVVSDDDSIYTSTDPTDPASWVQQAHFDGDMVAVDCANSGFCAATDTGKVFWSSEPTGGAGAWHRTRLPFRYEIYPEIACPSATFCVSPAEGRFGSLVVSRDPSGGPRSWHSRRLKTTGGLTSVSCPSISFCLATGFAGDVFTSSNPSGPGSAWHLSQTPQDEGVTSQVSCGSPAFCAVASFQDVFTSTRPAGGSWDAKRLTRRSDPLGALSCTSEAFCLVADGRGAVSVGQRR